MGRFPLEVKRLFLGPLANVACPAHAEAARVRALTAVTARRAVTAARSLTAGDVMSCTGGYGTSTRKARRVHGAWLGKQELTTLTQRLRGGGCGWR
jgi:hypothetical protein